ncbi:MAG: hypothetical protein ABH864_03740 [archaeon]
MSKLNQKTVMILLFVLLILAMVYIIFDKFQESRAQEKYEAFQEGMQTGYEQAVVQMMQELATCQSVPLFANNQTITAVALECLEQAQAQQQAMPQ